MNPEQVAALLLLLADLRIQITAQAHENAALRARVAELEEAVDRGPAAP